jgi:hypothetical protein
LDNFGVYLHSQEKPHQKGKFATRKPSSMDFVSTHPFPLVGPNMKYSPIKSGLVLNHQIFMAKSHSNPNKPAFSNG